MVIIDASTTHKMAKKPAVKPAPAGSGKKVAPVATATTGPAKQRGWAPPLKAATFLDGSAILQDLKSKDEAAWKDKVQDLFHTMLGESPSSFLHMSSPHAASTTNDRSGAAADLAVLAKQVTGLKFVLKDCGVYDEMQKILFPSGIEAVIKVAESQNLNDEELNVGLKPSRSAVSLTSMDDGTAGTSVGGDAAGASIASDSKRGKTSPAPAREGCLLFIRALCEIVGSPEVEPYVVGAFLAVALDECASGNSAVRQAGEDTAMAIVNVASPWSFFSVLRPLLMQTLHSTNEWRVKAVTLDCLHHCAKTKPTAVYKLIPKLLPPLVSQVWDTKPQVSKAARTALQAICETNVNPDIKKTIPAIVNAICKPNDTNKAISELMGTTFVVPVDAPTLAILCPILARGLKEKLAIHKRATCLVISNMSKLVERPESVAPFGSLLVPELQKVCENVQFQEIRDEALKALANLTKALGDSYKASEDQSAEKEMEAEQARVEAEQERVKTEREAEITREELLKKKEEEERQRFKEAMNAQRELEKLEAHDAAEKKKAEEIEREKAKLSTKGADGKCQGCGLKKCKKSCMFYSG